MRVEHFSAFELKLNMRSCPLGHNEASADSVKLPNLGTLTFESFIRRLNFFPFRLSVAKSFFSFKGSVDFEIFRQVVVGHPRNSQGKLIFSL